MQLMFQFFLILPINELRLHLINFVIRIKIS